MSASPLLLLFGGRSSEHEVSVRSATEVLAALDPNAYRPTLLGIDLHGRFRLGKPGQDLRTVIASGDEVSDIDRLFKKHDIVFPLLHGPYGEDGTLQGLLEVMSVPYIGSGVLASALCMDKAALKHHVRAAPFHIPVVPDLVISLQHQSLKAGTAQAREAVRNRWGFPCFVKPANQGSSVGITKAHDDHELETAIELASRYDDKILVEQGIAAREIELAVLGDGGPDTRISPAGEIQLPEGGWYDYNNKYETNVTTLSLPADLPPELLGSLQQLALDAFRATGCHGLARVDFFVDHRTGAIYLNEVNTMPGFTRISMYPKLIQAMGISYRELISRLCELGVSRHRRIVHRDSLRRPEP